MGPYNGDRVRGQGKDWPPHRGSRRSPAPLPGQAGAACRLQAQAASALAGQPALTGLS